MHRKIFLVLLVLFPAVTLAGLAAAGPARSGNVEFPLQGSQEVPPVTTDGSGDCTGYLNPLRTAFDISCSHNVGNAVAAHIHMAPAGTNGPIVFFLDASTSFSFTVSEQTLQQQQDDGLPVSPISFETFLDLLDSGGLYVNVHTPANPGGEIRGQIPAPPSNLFFAQFGNGAAGDTRLVSDLVLLNSATTGAAVLGSISFFDQSGVPIPPSQILGTNGSSVVQGAESLDFELPPLGNLTISTSGTGDVVEGSVTVSSSGPLGGVVRFDITGAGVAGVSSSAVVEGAIAPVRRVEGGINTGLAIVNPGAGAVTIGMSLRSEGEEVENGTNLLILGPGQSAADFLDELFPLADTSNFDGTVVITSDGGFAALVLEFDSNNGVFTTLPVIPLR